MSETKVSTEATASGPQPCEIIVERDGDEAVVTKRFEEEEE